MINKMGFQESASYYLYKNPICAGVIDVTASGVNYALSLVGLAAAEPAAPTIMPLWTQLQSGRYYIRIASICGATAVALGAYGAHGFHPKDKERTEELKAIFETANKYHFYHSLVLLGVPLCRYPNLSGFLFLAGIILFSGSCYHYALTEDTKFRKVTPFGGTCLILGWLSMIF